MNEYIQLIQENDYLEKKIKQIRQKYAMNKKKLKERKDEIITDLKKELIELETRAGKGIQKAVLDEKHEKISSVKMTYYRKLGELLTKEKNEIEAVKKGQQITKGTVYAIAGLAMATLIIKGSYEIYKHFTEIAEHQCSKLSGKEKEICIKKKRIEAIKKRIQAIDRQTIHCNKSKDPVKCKMAIHKYKLKMMNDMKEFGGEVAKKIGKWRMYS